MESEEEKGHSPFRPRNDRPDRHLHHPAFDPSGRRPPHCPKREDSGRAAEGKAETEVRRKVDEKIGEKLEEKVPDELKDKLKDKLKNLF